MLMPAILPSIGLSLGWAQPAAAETLRAYATAAQYVARYGRTEATQLLCDEERLLTVTLLDQAIASPEVNRALLPPAMLPSVGISLGWGRASAGEVVAGRDAVARLNRQLAVSSRFMDGYLRAVLKLPLAAGDTNASTLEDCCLALTRFELADDCDNVTDRMTKSAEFWRTWLRDVSSGKVALVKTATGTDITPAVARVRTGKIKSSFNWGSFG